MSSTPRGAQLQMLYVKSSQPFSWCGFQAQMTAQPGIIQLFKIREIIHCWAFIMHLPPIDLGPTRLARPQPGALLQMAAARTQTLDPETAASHFIALGTQAQLGIICCHDLRNTQ